MKGSEPDSRRMITTDVMEIFTHPSYLFAETLASAVDKQGHNNDIRFRNL